MKALIKTVTITNAPTEDKNGDYMKIFKAKPILKHNEMYCSRCKTPIDRNTFNFCPWCGAMFYPNNALVDVDKSWMLKGESNNRYS